MICERIALEIPYENAGREKTDYQPTLVTYIQEPQYIPVSRPAVIICPGGGYSFTSSREAECIALQYVAAGFQAFIVYYSCEPAVFPMALLELAKSIAIVREHADEWGVNKDKIMVEGFSAGGHLAASIGCFWNRPFVYEPLGLSADDIKPNGNILCYPVITSGEFAHRGSFDNLNRGLDQEKYLALTSLENQVTKDNPPTFLWHTFEDEAVPVENSLLYIGALRKANIETEFHMYPKGHHGLSLATDETKSSMDEILPRVQSWINLSIEWVKER